MIKPTFPKVLYTLLLFVFLMLVSTPTALAEGSRELTDNEGYRPWLQYAGDGTTTAGVLRDNTLKVYVNAGETIYLGSSAMGIGPDGDIRWTAPDGAAGQCSDQGATTGQIRNRTQEKTGPAPLANGGYVPCIIIVSAGQSGIWLINFISPQIGGGNPPSVLADGFWQQPADDSAIAAWDITVIDTTGVEQKGRAYASYLPLTLSRFERPLQSQLYIVTKDGYLYDWKLNGIQPTTFILFSNKKGFKIAATDEPSYESVMLTGGETNNLLPTGFELNAPDDPDLGTDITNKMFFNPPNTDLPATAPRPGSSTWLLSAPLQPIAISNLTFTPADGGVGGTLSFDANAEGRYQTFIDTDNDGLFNAATDIVIMGNAVPGTNTVEWNGLDKAGNPVDAAICYQITAQGVAGEVHFPIYDAEQNPNGMIIERLNGPNAPDSTIYYDDSMLGGLQALNGELSIGGGHAWTTVPGGDPNGFGNQKGIDTWTFALGENRASSLACEPGQLIVTKQDSLLIDDNSDSVANPGETLRYQVVVENSGAAPLTTVIFNDAPDANTTLIAGSVTTTQGAVTIGNTANDTVIEVDIGTLNGKESVTITFDVEINSPLATGITQVANQGFIRSSELPTQPTDDPDTATPDDPTITPIFSAPILTATKQDTVAIDADANGEVNPGDQLEYIVLLSNSGNTAATGILFTDTPDANTKLVAGSVSTSVGLVEVGNSNGDTTVRVNIGSLGVNETITIQFLVTINTPLSPSVTQVENQGLISSTEVPDVLTDDPDTPTPNDPTVTPIISAPIIDAFKRDTLAVDANGDGIVNPGDRLLYTIELQNSGNTTATDVTFSDLPDANTTLVSGSVRTDQGEVTEGNSAGDQKITMTIGDIASGAAVNISFEVTINTPLAATVMQVQNQGFFSGTNTSTTPTDDPDTLANDDPTVTPVVIPEAGVALLDATKRDSLETDVNGNGLVNPGDQLRYQIVVQNGGTGTAEDIVFTDTPDGNTTLVAGSVVTSQGSVTSGNNTGETTIAITIGDIEAGASVTITFLVDINNPLPIGTIEVANQGLLTSNNVPNTPTDDPDTPANDDPTRTPVVIPEPGVPLLRATKIDSLSGDVNNDGVANPGETLTYQIQVTNSGEAAADAIIFTDSPDANTSLIPGTVTTSQGTVTIGNVDGDRSIGIDLGTISPNEPVIITFQVRIGEPLPDGITEVANQGFLNGDNVPNTPTDDSDTPEPDDPTRTPVVIPVPGVGEADPILEATKRDSLLVDVNSDGGVSPGDTIRYEIVIQNSGEGAATEVVFDDSPDANTTLITGSVQTSAGTVTTGNSTGDRTISVSIGEMAPGASVTITLQVSINSSLPSSVTEVANQGIIRTTSTSSTVPTDDPDTSIPNDPTRTPLSEAGLSIRKTGAGPAGNVVRPTETINYQLLVENTGTITLTNVVVQDAIPTGTTYVANSAVPAVSNGPDPLQWTIPTLNIGQSVELVFSVTVREDITETVIRNAATIRSDLTPESESNEVEIIVTAPTGLEEIVEPQTNISLYLPLVNQ